MNPVSIPAMACVFKWGGAALGLPSFALLVLYAANSVRQRLAAPPSESNFGDNPDAVLMILKGLSQGIAAVASFAGGLAQLAFDIAAAAAGIGLVMAMLLWFTGRGLQADALWARLSASALLLGVVLIALLLALSLRGVGRLPMLALAGLGGLGLHALWSSVRTAASV